MDPNVEKLKSENRYLEFHCRTGIKESVDWLVEVMERSKRTEMLRIRAGVTNPSA